MSEVTTEVLVIGLILVLAVVIYVLVFGNFNPAYMKKTVYVGATADTADIPRASGLTDHVLTLMPKSGDKFYLNGQQSPDTSGIKTSLRLVSPTGSSVSPRTGSLSGVLYGKQLYIYPNNSGSATMCDYDVSATAPPANLRPMTFGVWKIQLIDEEQHVLANSYDVAMRYGTTSLPTAGGFITGLFRSDCSPYTRTVYGTLPSSINTTVGNMTVTHFNGASYLSLANDPGLSMTGDMAISLWMDPTATGDYSNPGNWHQILGKGSISGSTENDNYQLFQMGNKLVFEWNDRVTNTHYQAITQNPVLGTNWNYVTASISGGTIKIYNNNAELPLVYNQGLDPRSSSLGTTPPAAGVRLRSNTNPVTVGKQNAPSGSAFYYNGDIGALSLYNRALTPEEIAQNYAGYRA
ncbi:MAG: LamG domain-containing protein [Methanoregula sp.]|nr:LamG domain-containing protein [Methanoregula sp.]